MTIEQLLTGRLWLYDTTTGRALRRAVLADVISHRRAGGSPFSADGRWCGLSMADTVGFTLDGDMLARLIGVIDWNSTSTGERR